jgi:Na+/proline symporter
MSKPPSPTPTAWGVLGIMASCFFGIMCFYHVVYWVWQVVAFHSDKKEAWTHIIIWLVLGVGAALAWCWLVWLAYFPKKDKS